MTTDANALIREATALKAAGNLNAAVERLEAATRLQPRNAVARHNLAATLGDLGRWSEAEPQIREGFSCGLDAPQSWLVLARCLQGLGSIGEAEWAYLETLKREPTMYEAHRELAQLRWMTTGDVGAAMTVIDAALAVSPGDATLWVVRAQVLEHAGRDNERFELLAGLAARAADNAYINTLASMAALATARAPQALHYAQLAANAAPDEPAVILAMASAYLAVGEPVHAAETIERVRLASPDNQHAIALQATAWRMLADARYRELYDYNALVSVDRMDAPQGWTNLPAYIADLAVALKAVHPFREHPFNQSLRHGSQAAHILHNPEPAIRALPQALDAPIRRHLAKLGRGDDPHRARNTGNYAFQGMWSVQLHPGGYHIDHVHQEGWISSACYVETVRESGQEGWLSFGRPGTPTRPPLEAEHAVRPEPGMLALFPSYMWHGTAPFTGDQTRLTFAFDLVPA